MSKISVLKTYHFANHINHSVSANMRPANMKNSSAWSNEESLASATIITIMLPNATVKSQAAWRTDFILAGA